MKPSADLVAKFGLDLEAEVRKLICEGNWCQLLDVSARFRSYSSQNIMLLFSQACSRGFSPTLVTGYRGWQRLGRQVRKGEKALYILAPRVKKVCFEADGAEGMASEVLTGFRLVCVFDLCQTTGDDLAVPPEPKLLESESVSIGEVIARLGAFLELRGFTHCFEPLDSVNGFTDFNRRIVKVRSDVSSLQRLKTLLHETAHVVMHSAGHLSRVRAELEAESSAYVVCRALGFDSSSYSFPYVARWSQGNSELVGEVARSVHVCAWEILEFLEG